MPVARNPASMIVRDPVCGMELDEPRTFTQHEYDGQIYYFCSTECREKFKTDPDHFVPTVVERQTQFMDSRMER
jgi:YHS domain-containing protein